MTEERLDASGIRVKVQQYEAFLNDRLKEDLKKAQQRKAEINIELKEYDDLERSVLDLKQGTGKALVVHVDLGSEVLAQARVPDPSRICINIGMGFHVEVDLDDVPRVVGIKREALLRKRDKELQMVAQIKTHIRMVEEALAELQRL